MDPASAAASGASTAVRVGVQIVTSLKRPSIEIYHEVRRIEGPERTLASPAQGHAHEVKAHFPDEFVAIKAINIGGLRAENVSISVLQRFERGMGRRSIEPSEKIIPFMAAGQTIFMYKFHLFEMFEEEPDRVNFERPKETLLRIRIAYDGPNAGFNKIARLWCRIAKRKQYVFDYVFDARCIFDDLPPMEYS